jgi:dolichyl-phosphate-mannose-protein mannosyltransferase
VLIFAAAARLTMTGMTAVAVAGDTSVSGELLDRARRRLVRPLPPDLILGWLFPVAITSIAAVMRFWRITRPGSKVFDETYYAHDAYNLLHHGVELDSGHHDKTAGFVVHPPLGKWMIAVGEWIFGNHPLGWRFSAAVIGSASILLIARIARRLFRSSVLGCVAALLLSFDGLEFVQSRTSMLDIFLMFWVLAAFGCLLLDRDQGRRRLAEVIDGTGVLGARPFLGARPWRWATGLCLGAAAATKWNGGLFIPAFLALALWWDVGARRVAGDRHPIRTTLWRDGLYSLLPFILLPVVVYTVSWTGWFVSDGTHAYDHDRYVHAGQSWFDHDLAVLGGWLRYHWEIWRFHTTLAAAHPYLSNPLGWLLLARPVAYFYASPHGCGASACSQEVLGIGTPAIWWLSIPALVVALWRMVVKLDWRAAAIIVIFLTGYLTWIFDEMQTVPNCHPASNCHRTMFLFYLLPDVPFMVLALTMCIGLLIGKRTATMTRRVLGASTVAIYLSGVVWNFSYLYPVLSAQVITYSQWQDRMWLDVCDDKPHRNEHHESAPCWI